MHSCQEQNVSARQIRNNLKRENVVVTTGKVAYKVSLGRGTSVPASLEAVIEIDYGKIRPIVERQDDRRAVNFPDRNK